jgi:hypothetical protein
MSEPILFAGCLLAFASFAAVVLHYRTGLFGLTLLCVFHVAAETLSAFFFSFLLDEVPASFTPEHLEVWTYSVLGLLAMSAGVYFGWRPLNQLERQFPRGTVIIGAPAHINERIGWLSFCVGIAAELVHSTVWSIPTLSTAVDCLTSLGRIGMLIMLASALQTGRWRRLLTAVMIFGIISVLGSFESGHTFIKIDTLLPIVVIYVASSGLSPAFVLQGLLTFIVLIPMISAWLDTRVLIRSGFLDGMPMLDKLHTFFSEFINNLDWPSARSFMELLTSRVDMTEGLAAQVAWQPDFEPYAHGETVYSALYTLIPRFMWEDKPIVAGGSEFYSRFTGLTLPPGDTTSIGIAYPFELYANGGPVLAVIGLALIGFVCARLEVKLLSAPKNLGTFWALAMVTAVLCDGGQRTDVVLPAVVAAGITAYVLGLLIRRLVPSWGVLPAPFAGASRTQLSG